MWYIVLIKFSVSDAILRFILLPHVKGRLLLVRKLSPGQMFMNGHAGPGFPPCPWEPCGPRTLTPRAVWPHPAPRGTETLGGQGRMESPCPHFPRDRTSQGPVPPGSTPHPRKQTGIRCLQLILPTHTSSTPTVCWGKGAGVEAKQSTLRPPAPSPLSKESAF